MQIRDHVGVVDRQSASRSGTAVDLDWEAEAPAQRFASSLKQKEEPGWLIPRLS